MWSKIKEFFKKNWSYVVAFFGGVISMFCINKFRNKGFNRDINELRGKLLEYQNLLSETKRANTELAIELEEYRNNYSRLAEELGKCGDSAEDIERVNAEIGTECDKLSDSIERLRAFIQQNGKTE